MRRLNYYMQFKQCHVIKHLSMASKMKMDYFIRVDINRPNLINTLTLIRDMVLFDAELEGKKRVTHNIHTN